MLASMVQAPVDRVAVVGFGQIGEGLARLIASWGFPLTILVRRPSVTVGFASWFERRVRRAIRRNSVDEAAARVRLDSLRIVDDVAALSDADLVIEAISEDLGAKRALIAELGGICRPETILASTTSEIPIDQLTEDPAIARRTLGLHFIAPVRLNRAVEVIPGRATDRRVLERAHVFCRTLDREPFLFRRSVVNLVSIAYVAEGLAMCAEGVAPEEVDAQAVGAGFGLGPLATLDMIGLDVALAVLEREDGLRAAPDPKLMAILGELRRRGELGRKSGAGILCYGGEGGANARFVELLGAPRLRGPVDVEARLWLRVFGELLLCVAHNLGSVAELDQVITEVQGLDGGLCRRLAAANSADLLRELQAQEARLGGRYAPTLALVEEASSAATSAP